MIVEGETGFVCDALDIAARSPRLSSDSIPRPPRAWARTPATPWPALTPQAMAQQYLALYRRLLHR